MRRIIVLGLLMAVYATGCRHSSPPPDPNAVNIRFPGGQVTVPSAREPLPTDPTAKAPAFPVIPPPAPVAATVVVPPPLPVK
jgi:hypothetical protein